MSSSEQCRSASAPTVADVWEKLLVDGWTIVADDNPDLGLDPTFRDYVNETYFGEDGILEPESYDIFPPDRKRARGVVGASFNVRGEPGIWDMPPVAVVNQDRGVPINKRIYKQTRLSNDTRFRHWISSLIGLVPPEIAEIPGIGADAQVQFDANILFEEVGRTIQNTAFYEALTGAAPTTAAELRQVSSTVGYLVGVNLFETRSDVVSGPHHDYVRWNAVTVIAHQGGGAVSQLFHLDNTTEPFLEYRLAPGQTLIMNDRRFQHSVTPLEPKADGSMYRRTIVCTFE